MSTLDKQTPGQGVHKHGIPWSHVVGFVLSLILTGLALWMGLSHVLSFRPLFTVILGLAVLQILVQLFFFMHVREGHGPAWHVWMLVLGLLFTFTIVAGSIWIMTFGSEIY
ncbi:cytochrome o ubiquinol oxidase subunit IV [Aneurinibacillus tyrosinisolvens]|uniref:cytochrome o ubiquinol oxidase subunit IV n=1 Tax=Aneurinibacillus tyrosinisolvens TaxID=1443435 RepID=UPI00063F2876|nr:cytochrome C oxidase subunit IV family protein [Aneurinibacillus tyrosinisolvens]